mgnify:CR=1 FL=1
MTVIGQAENVRHDVEHDLDCQGTMAIAKVSLEIDDVIVAIVVVGEIAKGEQGRDIAFETIMAQDPLYPIHLMTPVAICATVWEVEDQILPFFNKLHVIPHVPSKFKNDKVLISNEPEEKTHDVPTAKVRVFGQVPTRLDFECFTAIR